MHGLQEADMHGLQEAGRDGREDGLRDRRGGSRVVAQIAARHRLPRR